jgi:hypothetical protein
MAHDVFISHSSLDKPVADAMCALLEADGVRCWIAPRDVLPGVPFAETIIDAIAQSRILVLIFSSRSNDSDQVLREVDQAVRKGIYIVPFRIENVPLSKPMEYYVAATHWLDALTPPLERHLQYLAETIRILQSRSRGTIDEQIAEREARLPSIYNLTIPSHRIRSLIGPGGKVMSAIIEQTGVKIDIEDDGTVHVASADEASAQKAIEIICDITGTAQVGMNYLGKVVRLVDFGAFVEILPGVEGMLPISEIAEKRIQDVRDELKEGDQVLVKVLALEGNKIKLSRKAALTEQHHKLKHQVRH